MTDTPTIHQALAAVMADVRAVAKGDHNSQQGFNFRGIDAVVNAVGPRLRDHGVIVTPELTDYQYGEVAVGKNRTPMAHVRVTVAFHFYGPAGDHLTAVVPGEAMDSGDKATPKAMSVAFRIALLQALALPTHEPDPDTTAYERSAPDPLEAARQQALEVAKRKAWQARPEGWDADRFRHEFEQHAATSLEEGDEQAFATFAKHLEEQPTEAAEALVKGELGATEADQ